MAGTSLKSERGGWITTLALPSPGLAELMLPTTGAFFGIAGTTIKSTAFTADNDESIAAAVADVGIAVISVVSVAVPAPGTPGCGPQGEQRVDGEADGRGADEAAKS